MAGARAYLLRTLIHAVLQLVKLATRRRLKISALAKAITPVARVPVLQPRRHVLGAVSLRVVVARTTLRTKKVRTVRGLHRRPALGPTCYALCFHAVLQLVNLKPARRDMSSRLSRAPASAAVGCYEYL